MHKSITNNVYRALYGLGKIMHSKTDNFYNNLKLGYMKKGIREINTEQQGKSKLGRNIKLWFP